MENKDIPLEIVFSTPKVTNIVTKFIKFHMGTKFCHVCIKVDSTYYERTMIYEASKGSVHCSNYINWEKTNKVIDKFSLCVNEDRKKKIIQWAMDHLGNPYSKRALFGMWLEDTFGIKNKIGINKDKKFICSEFTVVCLDDELDNICRELKISEIKNADHVDPKEVYNLLLKYRALKGNI
jgi:hypothetical protein